MYKIKSRGLATDRTQFPRYASEVWLGNWTAHFLNPLTISYTSIESRAHGKRLRKAKLGRRSDRSNNLRIAFKWTNEICKGVFFCVQPICIDEGFPIGARNDNRKGFFSSNVSFKKSAPMRLFPPFSPVCVSHNSPGNLENLSTNQWGKFCHDSCFHT